MSRKLKEFGTAKLSKTSKMPAYSWSLSAIKTCPGAIDKSKESKLVPVCENCYATVGFFRMPVVKAVRENNERLWKEDTFVNDFIKVLNGHEYFRWLDSGDIFSIKLMEKIYEICKETPDTQHWIPTRMYKFKKFESLLSKLGDLPNVSLRYSGDDFNKKVDKGNGSIVTTDKFDYDKNKDVVKCEAYEREGKCGECRSCWNKSVKHIAYPIHSVSTKKINLINIGK